MGRPQGSKDRPGNNHYLYNLKKRYDTGWKENLLTGAAPDWTNVHLGDDNTGDSNVAHGLDGNLGELQVQLLISTDGTDANSFEPRQIDGGSDVLGWSVWYVDNDTIKVQTGTDGLGYISDAGTLGVIDTEAWYYRIIVYKINCKDYSNG